MSERRSFRLAVKIVAILIPIPYFDLCEMRYITHLSLKMNTKSMLNAKNLLNLIDETHIMKHHKSVRPHKQLKRSIYYKYLLTKS